MKYDNINKVVRSKEKELEELKVILQEFQCVEKT